MPRLAHRHGRHGARPSNSHRPLQCAIAELDAVPTPRLQRQIRGKVVHFSEIRFIGSREPENLRAVAASRRTRVIEIEIGMKSICPTSKMFDPRQGRRRSRWRMLESATLAGSRIVRRGSGQRRRTVGPGPIRNAHREHREGARKSASKRGPQPRSPREPRMRLQAHELKTVIEEAGKDRRRLLDPAYASGPWKIPTYLVRCILRAHQSRARFCRVACCRRERPSRGFRMDKEVGIDESCRKYAELARGRRSRWRPSSPTHAYRIPRSQVLGSVPRCLMRVVHSLLENRRPPATAPATPPGPGQAAARQREREDRKPALKYKTLLGSCKSKEH